MFASPNLNQKEMRLSLKEAFIKTGINVPLASHSAFVLQINVRPKVCLLQS